jgi:hypothetical protein
MTPTCETEMSDETWVSACSTKLISGEVSTVRHGGNVIACQIVSYGPVLCPVRNSRQTVTSAAATKVADRSISVAVEFNHRNAS